MFVYGMVERINLKGIIDEKRAVFVSADEGN